MNELSMMVNSDIVITYRKGTTLSKFSFAHIDIAGPVRSLDMLCERRQPGEQSMLQTSWDRSLRGTVVVRLNMRDVRNP
jgi:hypothetical protein